MTTKAFARFSFRSLTPQLFLLVILPLIILLFGIALVGLSLHQKAMRSLVAERDLRSVRAAAGNLEEQITHRETALIALSLRVSPETEDSALTTILENVQAAQPKFDLGLSFIARGGAVLAYTGDGSFWESLSATSNPDLRLLLNRDVPPNLILISDPLSGDPVMLVTATPFKGGPVAVGAFSPAELANLVLAEVFTPGESSAAFMVDNTFRVIYRVGDVGENAILESHAGVKEALDGESGAYYVEINGREHVVAFSPIPSVGWALVIEEPWEEVTSPLLRTTENAPLVLVPALALAVLALWFGLRQVVQPLQALGEQAVAVGAGDFESIEKPVGGVAEIQQLQMELIHLARKVQSSQRGLRGYIGAITTGQEEERRRLARELHDDTLQALIALNQRVQLVRLSASGVSSNELAEIQDLIGQTLVNLRRITRALRPIFLDELGLAAALKTLADEARNSTEMNINYKQKGEQRRLSAVQELSLYRIAQEALNNVIKHARASYAVISLEYAHRDVILRVADNGIGFDIPDSPAEMTPQGHFGLLGLYERADLIGARLQIESVQGQGTIVTVTASTPEVEVTKESQL